MRKKTLFLLESPLQVSNAIASKEINDESTLLIRLNDFKNNDELILNEINGFESRFIFSAKRNSKVKLMLWVLFFFVFFSWRTHRIYLGDARSTWMKLVEKLFLMSEIIYLDDGMATIKIYEDVIKKNSKVTFLTRFPLKPTNNVSIRKIQEVDDKQFITRHKEVYFIGAALSANRLLDTKCYISIIKNEIESYKSKGYEIVFFPHRYESLDVIEALSEVCIINSIGTSIENYVIDSRNVPEVIISFASTALFNLSDKLCSTEIISLNFLKHCLLDERVCDFELVYSFFERHCDNIKVRNV
ncbi:hypothetical protein [Photobacterium sp. J15]|uniref:hypothetical protein n=1 Tax=Photobacterium sp. J15 TaxID=265901 RepID=UPI0007E305F6|nr:hypothetical protein [Photobacterium sp. J15]